MFSAFIALLMWIEDSSLARWVGESQWGFPIALTLHALGMGMLAGGNSVLGLRLLGIGASVQGRLLIRFYPLLWGSAAISIGSGLLLFSAYPAKALTNPLFFIKLALIAVGVWLMQRPLQRCLLNLAVDNSPTTQQRLIGAGAILLWLMTIGAGRFLAYTSYVLRAIELLPR
jgi:hypothetical protein